MNTFVRGLLVWVFGTPKQLKQVGYLYIAVSILVIAASVWAVAGLMGCVTLYDPGSLEGMKRTAKAEQKQAEYSRLCTDALEKSNRVGGKSSRKVIFVYLPHGMILTCRQ